MLLLEAFDAVRNILTAGSDDILPESAVCRIPSALGELPCVSIEAKELRESPIGVGGLVPDPVRPADPDVPRRFLPARRLSGTLLVSSFGADAPRSIKVLERAMRIFEAEGRGLLAGGGEPASQNDGLLSCGFTRFNVRGFGESCTVPLGDGTAVKSVASVEIVFESLRKVDDGERKIDEVHVAGMEDQSKILIVKKGDS